MPHSNTLHRCSPSREALFTACQQNKNTSPNIPFLPVSRSTGWMPAAWPSPRWACRAGRTERLRGPRTPRRTPSAPSRPSPSCSRRSSSSRSRSRSSRRPGTTTWPSTSSWPTTPTSSRAHASSRYGRSRASAGPLMWSPRDRVKTFQNRDISEPIHGPRYR